MVKWAQQMNCGCDTCLEGERFVNNLSGLSHKEQDWMVGIFGELATLREEIDRRNAASN